MIEFALVAPIVISLLLSISDLAPTLMVKFKLGAAAQAVADIATLSATMQTADIANDFAVGGDVMAPFSATPLVLRITNVASDGNGNAWVYWSCGQSDMAPYAARSAVASTPTGTAVPSLLTLTATGANTSYVMVEARYIYTAPAGFLLRSAQTMSFVTYTLPRVSTYIAPWNGDPNYKPNGPIAATNTITLSGGGLTCNLSY